MDKYKYRNIKRQESRMVFPLGWKVGWANPCNYQYFQSGGFSAISGWEAGSGNAGGGLQARGLAGGCLCLCLSLFANNLAFYTIVNSPSITTSSSSSLSLSSPGLATIVPLQKSSSRRTTTSSSTWKTCQQRPWRRRRSTAASCKVDLLAGERVQSTSYLRRSTRRRCFLITVPESSISCPRRWLTITYRVVHMLSWILFSE